MVMVCMHYSENSDDEADDVSPVEGDVVGGATGVRSRSLSSWALSLRVEDGLISMLPEVEHNYMTGHGQVRNMMRQYDAELCRFFFCLQEAGVHHIVTIVLLIW